MPRLDYGSQLYITANKAVLGVLSTIQSTALRLATGAFRTGPFLSLGAKTSIMPLHYRRTKLTARTLPYPLFVIRGNIISLSSTSPSIDLCEKVERGKVAP